MCWYVYRYKHELQIYCVGDGGSVLLVMCCVLASFLPAVYPSSAGPLTGAVRA